MNLSFPNRTKFTNGTLVSGKLNANLTSAGFVFTGLTPGNYALNLTTTIKVFLPPVSASVSSGSNALNLTVYQLSTFGIIVNATLAFNGTQPGPPITVKNGTAVRLMIQNNTTQVFNIAVVRNLFNTSSDNVQFNSLSSTISAGGSVNDTFIVSVVGAFYYQSMIENQAKQGEYGNFTVAF